MAAFNKFQAFVLALAHKKHHLGSDQLKIALCAAANPPAAGNAVLADLTEISYTNCSTRNVSTASSSQTSGTYSLTLTDLVLTASGGSVAAFRYANLYNDTATNKDLIGYWDRGSELTLAAGDQVTLDFTSTAITLA